MCHRLAGCGSPAVKNLQFARCLCVPLQWRHAKLCQACSAPSLNRLACWQLRQLSAFALHLTQKLLTITLWNAHAEGDVQCRVQWSPILERYAVTAAVVSSQGQLLFKGLSAKVCVCDTQHLH